MAVLVIGELFFFASVVFFAVTLWERSKVRRVTGVPAASQIHAELAPADTSKSSTPTTSEMRSEPDQALVSAAAAATPAAPALKSYYTVAPPSNAEGRPRGWYSVNANVPDERFWDGGMWTARRQVVWGVWASVPLGD